MSQEEIIKALTSLGYPLEKLRQYHWFRRGEQHPSVSIDNRNIWSQGVEHRGQEYLVPGVATQNEIWGISPQGIEGLDYTSHSRPVSADMQEIPHGVTDRKLEEQSSMSYLGQPWGIPVKNPDEGTLLGELISKYMGSLGGF